MNSDNNYSQPNTNKVSYLPRPLRQGHLDRLCGVYAIINACRQAFASMKINKKLGSWELVSVLAGALEERGKLATVICYGMSVKDYNDLLVLAVKFMLRKHGLVLKIKRPLKRIKAPSLIKVFNLVSHHLKQPGTSALLEFEAPSYGHWTVISHIHKGRVHFLDSTGMRPRSIKDFQIKSPKRKKLKRPKKLAYAKSGLVLLEVESVS